MPVTITLDVLYEDNHLLIVNKPAGTLVQGDITRDNSLIDAAKLYLKKQYKKPGNIFVGLPHRLDRPVSGACVLCKTSKGLERMSKLFADRSIEKTYHAVVSHQPEKEKNTLVHYLKKIEKINFAKLYHTEAVGTKKAILHYTFLRKLSNNYLLEVQLETGRHHQIRAQLASIGCAVLGDLKYGSKFVYNPQAIGLHAYSVAFKHPISNEKINIVAPYPAEKVWQQAGA
jgi:23S rRNA pseudouridine1911/1915/1917 synthase